MSNSTLTVNATGNSYEIDGNRLTNGGVYHSNVSSLLSDLVASANGVQSFTPVSVANGGTVALSSLSGEYNVLRPTSDGTIAGAVLNLPTSPSNGQLVILSTTGAITTVTGTISGSGVLPAVTSLSAGQVVRLAYNATAAKWFHV